MFKAVEEFLGRVQILEPVSWQALTMFPLKVEGYSIFPYLLLDEAVASGDVIISEVGEQGTVPQLVVSSCGQSRVLMMDGEELVGAKQNRILNTSIMLEVGKMISIPVSCVEQGRWRFRTKTMQPGQMSYPGLREKKAASVSHNLKNMAVCESDQMEVWNCVEEKISACRAHSPTSSMNDVYHSMERGIEPYLENLKYPAGATGVAAVAGGKVICVDLFDCARTMEKQWNKLVSSYVLDAIEEKPSEAKAAKEGVQSFLDSVKDAQFEEFDSPGLGKDVRISGKGITGAALVCEGTVIHLELFKKQGKDREFPDKGLEYWLMDL